MMEKKLPFLFRGRNKLPNQSLDRSLFSNFVEERHHRKFSYSYRWH